MSSASYIQTSCCSDPTDPICIIDEEVIIRGSLNADIPRHLYRHPKKGIMIKQPPIKTMPVILAVSSQMCDLIFLRFFHHDDQENITLPRHLACHIEPCELNERNLYFDFHVNTAHYTTNRFTCYHRQNLNEICEMLAWPEDEVPFIKIAAHVYKEQK